MGETIFLSHARTAEEKRAACLLAESLRTFGGDLSRCPFWLFDVEAGHSSIPAFQDLAVEVIPLDVPEPVSSFDFGAKVYACARAEELAGEGAHSLVWIDPACLVVNPPLLYELGEAWDAAVRPVHIRNVGLRVSDPVDAYWREVYETAGGGEGEISVESFVDRQELRGYFNTHAFAVNPRTGLVRRWLELFTRLVDNDKFQSSACQDETHKIFLHQAVFSALVGTALQPSRVRLLAPTYNYPYNLHSKVPADRQARALNDLVTFTYEGRSIVPALVSDIEIREPLRSWLER